MKKKKKGGAVEEVEERKIPKYRGLWNFQHMLEELS